MLVNLILETVVEEDLEFFKNMSESKINMKKIESSEKIIRNALITAESLFIEYYRVKNNPLLDFSLILIAYSRALENILYEKILVKHKTDYRSKYQPHITARQFRNANHVLKK